MYTIYVETHFAASHQLHGYEGACRALHGHTWKVGVEVKTDCINPIGISVDFKELKDKIRSVIDRLDHHHINEIPPFDKINPTAENLSLYIFEEVQKTLPSHAGLSKVTVWESSNYAVSYSGE